MNDKLLEIINLILKKKSKKILSKLEPNITLMKDIGFDSLDLAELTVRIEAEFEIDIFEDGIVMTVGQILEKLKNK